MRASINYGKMLLAHLVGEMQKPNTRFKFVNLGSYYNYVMCMLSLWPVAAGEGGGGLITSLSRVFDFVQCDFKTDVYMKGKPHFSHPSHMYIGGPDCSSACFTRYRLNRCLLCILGNLLWLVVDAALFCRARLLAIGSRRRAPT
jgi:hypothetical protein